jgi:hypothetical protein
MPIILDGTNGLDSPDLNITGTGARITGDFSNATGANRVSIQTSTTNGNTILNVIPNGTATNTQLRLFNAVDPDNASIAQLVALSGTEVRIASAIAGTGTYLPLTMYTGGSERLRVTTAGVVELTSGQLKFPASQSASSDANTLDDYEEGTWTPVFSAGGITGSNLSYSGTYTKIGRVVTIIFQVTSTSDSNNVVISSYAGFSGLPFSVASTGGSGAVTSEDIDVFSTLGFSSVGSTTLFLSKSGSGTQTTTLKTSVTYFTAT